MGQTSVGRALRFLVTNSCNLRCGFCHNEFQGDVTRPGQPWDEALVLALLEDAARRGPVRIKFSGGEPLLRWRELMRLLGLVRQAGIDDLTVFSNLTLLSPERLQGLSLAGVSRLNVNLPSFDSDIFARCTGQSRWNVRGVMDNSSTARRAGVQVQLNMVLPAFPNESALRERIERELASGWTHEECWDRLSFLADDWSAHPDHVRSWIRDALSRLPGAAECESPPSRSYEFRWRSKSLLASRCTSWGSEQERDEADLYVVPPGRVLTQFVRGHAYR